MAPGTLITALHFLCNLLIGAKARVLHYSKLEMLVKNKYSSLLGPFVSFGENKGL
jgi:hypothetical protein